MGIFGWLFDKFVTVKLDTQKTLDAILIVLDDPAVRSRFIAKMDEAIIGSKLVEKFDGSVVTKAYDDIIKKLKSLKSSNSIPKQITLVR